MTFYSYACDVCGFRTERAFPMGRAAKWLKCRCGKRMLRDYAGEQQVAMTDPETTTADIDKNIGEVRSGKRVGSRVLSQSLADVPGARTIEGRDGRRYAMFRTKKERDEVCAAMGLPD